MNKQTTLQNKVDSFNAACPIGTRVNVRMDNGDIKTTTVSNPASVLGGHTPVAWLAGISGCFALDRVSKAK
jgi:hypothetical protein